METNTSTWTSTAKCMTKHRESVVLTPEYISWKCMRARCFNPKATQWQYYGGRGITICLEWIEYKNFLQDMGRRPTPHHSLERRDGNGNYNKSNCYWATKLEQARNRAKPIITLPIARKIRKEYAQGVVQTILAKKYRVTQAHISGIIHGRVWRE